MVLRRYVLVGMIEGPYEASIGGGGNFKSFACPI
jgi:hypothetical protein